MNRRQFLQRSIALTLANAVPAALIKPAYGATPDRFLITVNASGGWDPTSLIDPKGNAPRSDGLGPVNNFSASAIKSAGNLLYAPYSTIIEPPSSDSAGHFDSFFNKHYEKLLVINGIDTQTNGHDSGRRFVWSGQLQEGYPTVAALAAAPFAEQPMAFISNGGYDFTASLVAPVRTADASTFSALAYPNSQFPNNDALLSARFISDASYEFVQQARAERLTRLRMMETLPKRQLQMDQLSTARNTDAGLETLLSYLPEQVSSGLKGQAEVALAAFASGLAVSATLNVGGFDSHGDHDEVHTASLIDLLDGLDHLWEQVELNGLQDKVTIIVGSDFGRTPFYNSGDGKDHWNITSVIAMGAGITGNRVIGGTNENFEALAINAETLETDSNGLIMTPQHIHRSLRDFLGIQSDLDKLFPIDVETLALFG
jgi:uncharacterized protein (DUF1501 family)